MSITAVKHPHSPNGHYRDISEIAVNSTFAQGKYIPWWRSPSTTKALFNPLHCCIPWWVQIKIMTTNLYTIKMDRCVSNYLVVVSLGSVVRQKASLEWNRFVLDNENGTHFVVYDRAQSVKLIDSFIPPLTLYCFCCFLMLADDDHCDGLIWVGLQWTWRW